LLAMSAPQPVSVPEAIANLQFLPARLPSTTDEDAREAFGQLAPYRDGGVFVAHWAGSSEWERHPVGDEIVMVVEGDTTIFFLTEEGERSGVLGAGDLVVVPRNTWHRFETSDRVKLMSVTPQPTDHSPTRPA
jgi:mannose-6-phosphate isomerase-like protein (cupin superfamily)